MENQRNVDPMDVFTITMRKNACHSAKSDDVRNKFINCISMTTPIRKVQSKIRGSGLNPLGKGSSKVAIIQSKELVACQELDFKQLKYLVDSKKDGKYVNDINLQSLIIYSISTDNPNIMMALDGTIRYNRYTKLTPQQIKDCVKNGRIEMIKSTLSGKIKTSVNGNLLKHAITTKSIDFIVTLLKLSAPQKFSDPDIDALHYSIKTGFVDGVKYIINHQRKQTGIGITTENLAYSITHNKLEVLKLLVEKKKPDYAEKYMNFILASKLGRIQIVRWFVESGINPRENNERGFVTAAMNGNLDIMQYFISKCKTNPCIDNNKALALASKGGHINVVKFLTTHCGASADPRHNNAFKYAANASHLDIVKYLYTTGISQPAVLNSGLDCFRIRAQLDIAKYIFEVERGKKMNPL
jgi:ankyrin repeat protein